MVIAAVWVLIGMFSGEGFVGFLIGAGIAIAVLLEYYIAGLFYFIGVDKGYRGKAYLWLAALIPAVGYLLIVAMPDRGGKPQVEDDELPDL